MVWYCILEHFIVSFFISFVGFKLWHFFTGSGPKVIHSNFGKGREIFTFQDECLAF